MSLIPEDLAKSIDEIITPQEAKRRLNSCEQSIHTYTVLERIADGKKPKSFMDTYQQVVAEENARFRKIAEGR